MNCDMIITPISFRTIGPLIYENQFIQISTSLPTSYLYGFGESNHDTFLRSFDASDPKSTYAIFARDHWVEYDVLCHVKYSLL